MEAQKVQPKVGEILVSTWGYEQTNVDFYVIEKVLPASVKLRRIGNTVISGDPNHSTKEIPNLEVKGSTVVTKRIRYYQEKLFIKVGHSQYAEPWNGFPVTATHYA